MKNKDIEFNKTDLSTAISILIKELEKDKKPGSCYFSWQSNIAMKIYEMSNLKINRCNEIAISFLDMLIAQGRSNG